jgi:hypothetical protein
LRRSGFRKRFLGPRAAALLGLYGSRARRAVTFFDHGSGATESAIEPMTGSTDLVVIGGLAATAAARWLLRRASVVVRKAKRAGRAVHRSTATRSIWRLRAFTVAAALRCLAALHSYGRGGALPPRRLSLALATRALSTPYTGFPLLVKARCEPPTAKFLRPREALGIDCLDDAAAFLDGVSQSRRQCVARMARREPLMRERDRAGLAVQRGYQEHSWR